MQGLQRCGERGLNIEPHPCSPCTGGSSFSSEPSELASELFSSDLPGEDNRRPAAKDLQTYADEQQSKRNSNFACFLSVLTVSLLVCTLLPQGCRLVGWQTAFSGLLEGDHALCQAHSRAAWTGWQQRSSYSILQGYWPWYGAAV